MKRGNGEARGKRGQAIIFLIMALVILFFAVIWNVDLHKIVGIRSISQNAGDSAALMAARWQGIALNLIGDLNIMQAVAIANGQPDTAADITNLQARICFIGPMIGLMASQQAAKNNRIYANDGYGVRITEEFIPTVVSLVNSGRQEAYDGAWSDLLDIMRILQHEGAAAMAEPLWPDEPHGNHYLFMPAFYEAIASRNWCWFLGNAYDLLKDYYGYTYWENEDPIPEPVQEDAVNSVFFGLGLVRQTSSVTNWVPYSVIDAAAEDRGLDRPVSEDRMGDLGLWYCYGPSWTRWDAISRQGEYPFPAAGRVKPQYDYAGADAYVRVEAGFERLTPGPGGSLVSNTIAWTAAAKPFGFLNESDRPNDYQMVLPAFREVHLIALDASSSTEGNDPNLEWQMHLLRHIDPYLAGGPSGLPLSCFYCNQLRTWEIPAFRNEGLEWLRLHSDDCRRPGGGGPGGGGPGGGGPGGGGPPGGRRRGH